MKNGDRIVIISPVYPISEKKIIATWAHQQAKAIKELGYTVEVISPTPYIPDFVAQSGRLLQLAKIPKTQTIDGVTVHYPRSIVYKHRTLNEYLYERVPMVENISSYIPIRSYIREIVGQSDVRGLICHNPVPAGYIGLKLRGEFDGPLLTLFHSATELDRSSQNDRLRAIFEKVITRSDHVVTVSVPMSERFEEHYGVSPHIIRNGFDPKEVDRAYEIQHQDDAHLEVLSVGSLIERKGHEFLIRALGRLHNNGSFSSEEVTCKIVGTGPKEESLSELVTDLGLSEIVHFEQNLSREKLNDLMHTADLFVLPSWNEPCAVVYTEVMPHATPVIMCEGQGLSDIVAEHDLGLTVPPRDVSALEDAISTLLTDDDRRAKIGQNARTYVYENLTWEDNAKELIGLVNESMPPRNT